MLEASTALPELEVILGKRFLVAPASIIPDPSESFYSPNLGEVSATKPPYKVQNQHIQGQLPVTACAQAAMM